MQKDKHNIYSKEELLKLIKEGKKAPADMDEFDLEALDGLKMLENFDVLNNLNKGIDKIVIEETNKEKQRKTIYYFSAAASLLLLVGLVFFFKNSDVIQDEKVVASAEKKPKEENLQQPLNAPVQAGAQGTYKAKEPEQVKTKNTRSETTAPAENKAKQKSEDNKADIVEERSFGAKKQDENLSDAQPVLIDLDTKSGGLIEKESFQQQASKDINSTISTQAGVIAADENRVTNNEPKSKKVVAASLSQPSMAYQSKNQASFVAQSSAAPADSKKAEEKSKSDFHPNTALKNDAAKNYTEPSFINGDSTFEAYVKQNLNISSTTNSGIMVVEFLVHKDGTTTNIEILKSLNNCDACSKDVIDLIKSIKKWQPAIENGKVISAPKKISIQYN